MQFCARRLPVVAILLTGGGLSAMAGCGRGTSQAPTAATGPVAIRVVVRVNSLDAFGATPADFPVSVGAESVTPAADGVVLYVQARMAFQVRTGAEKAEGHAEAMTGFCSGDSGAPTRPGEERLCTVTETEQPLKCDADLWRRTYAPWRLRKFVDCEIGAGTLQEAWQSEDGDLDATVQAAGAPPLAQGQRLLILEVPCQFPTTWPMAKEACGNQFQNTVRLAPGMRVRYAGPRVSDNNHTPTNPQTEIHGAVIRILSRPIAAPQAESVHRLPLRREGYLGGGRYEPESEPFER
jgi:hypothetical protein